MFLIQERVTERERERQTERTSAVGTGRDGHASGMSGRDGQAFNVILICLGHDNQCNIVWLE